MAPPQGTKRKSDEGLLTTSPGEGVNEGSATPGTIVRNQTPNAQQPQKKQKRGITVAQKQALIDNLQLEITERARKLRAQYNLQAQGLRTRIEIRVNRIPGALRKAKMGDLADKYQNGQQPQLAKAVPTAALPSAAPRAGSWPPPVPEKDHPRARSDAPRATAGAHSIASSRPGPGRSPQKARCDSSKPYTQGLSCINMSSEGALGHKRNHGGEKASPRKRVESTRTTTVLSPASGNVRPLPKHTPGGKSFTTMRPTPSAENIRSPLKPPAKQFSTPKVFSKLAEKARSARKDTEARRLDAMTPRAVDIAPITMSTKKPVINSEQRIPMGAPTVRPRRRDSDASESTVSSTSTVTRKTARSTHARNGVLGPIKRGASGAGVTKKTAASRATGASTATARSLRKRTLISERH